MREGLSSLWHLLLAGLGVAFAALFGTWVVEKAPAAARALIRAASWLFADATRERWQRDALADLEYIDGQPSKLVGAISMVWHLPGQLSDARARFPRMRLAKPLTMVYGTALAITTVAGVVAVVGDAIWHTDLARSSMLRGLVMVDAYIVVTTFPVVVWISTLMIRPSRRALVGIVLSSFVMWFLSLPFLIADFMSRNGFDVTLTQGLFAGFAFLFAAQVAEDIRKRRSTTSLPVPDVGSSSS